jgi:hypothetical protein
MAARLGTLLGCCLWGALGGWAAAMAATHPEVWTGAPPRPALVLYGAAAWFGSGYLLGSAMRQRPPSRLDLRVAGLTAALAFALKALAPALAAWSAVLLAGAVFGCVAGVIQTRPPSSRC